MARLRSGVCANPAGRGNAARTVRLKIKTKKNKKPRTDLRTHTHISVKTANACCHVTAQTSMSVPILNFQPDVTKNVTTFPVVSSASVKAATSLLTESPVWVRLHLVQLQWFFYGFIWVKMDT